MSEKYGENAQTSQLFILITTRILMIRSNIHGDP